MAIAISCAKCLLFPGFATGRAAIGLLALRLVTGVAFVLHGWPKIQHPFDWMDRPEVPSYVPGIFQALAAFSEFGGGLALILGVFTPLAAMGIAFTMVGALVLVHLPNGDPFVATSGKPSFELAAVYLINAILLILIGPGAISFDAFLCGWKRPCGEGPEHRPIAG